MKSSKEIPLSPVVLILNESSRGNDWPTALFFFFFSNADKTRLVKILAALENLTPLDKEKIRRQSKSHGAFI